MHQSIFSESFAFRQYTYRTYHYNDARNGNDCHYLGYMREGEGLMVGETVSLRVQKGELFYIPMGLRYESHWSGTPEAVLDSYAFTIFPHSDSVCYGLQKIPVSDEIREHLEALASHKTVDCFSIGKLYLLLDAMRPQMIGENQVGKQAAVQEALRYMQGCKEFSVPALARHCHMSESGVYAAFRTVKGCTPVEMWHHVLAERAVNLLVTTDLSVEEISEKLGFCSASYFRKILREVTGETPRRIRKREGI